MLYVAAAAADQFSDAPPRDALELKPDQFFFAKFPHSVMYILKKEIGRHSTMKERCCN